MQKWNALLAVIFVATCSCSKKEAQEIEVKPTMRLIRLDTGGKDYVNLVRNGDTSYVLRSGLVELAPGKNVGKHSSGQYEELVIPLVGKGEMTSDNHDPVAVSPENAIYCPPGSVHDVTNTGDTPLRYVYVVARVENKSAQGSP